MTARHAVLYGRVSKIAAADQIEGKSVDQQLDILTGIAEREEVHVVGVFRDDGVSASRYAGGKTRGGWQDTMQTITDGRVNELWVWEISRATRDRPVWSALIAACMAQNVLIVIAGKVHDPNDPDDGFMLDLLAALAIRESAITSKRIKRHIRAAAADGKPHGRIAYGYMREYDPITRALVAQRPDPDLAPIVAEIFHRVAEKETGYSIANNLNARGVPSPHEARAARLGRAVDDPYPWTLNRFTGSPVTPPTRGCVLTTNSAANRFKEAARSSGQGSGPGSLTVSSSTGPRSYSPVRTGAPPETWRLNTCCRG